MLPSWVWAEPRSARRGRENPETSIHHAAEPAKKKGWNAKAFLANTVIIVEYTQEHGGGWQEQWTEGTLAGIRSTPRSVVRYGRRPQNTTVTRDGSSRAAAEGPRPRKVRCHGFPNMFLFSPTVSVSAFRESISVEENRRHWVSPLSRRHWLKYSNLSFKQK